MKLLLLIRKLVVILLIFLIVRLSCYSWAQVQSNLYEILARVHLQLFYVGSRPEIRLLLAII